MNRTSLKPLAGRMVCTYCGATNPDSESTCPDTGTRHTLVSSSDKQELGQNKDKGPTDDPGSQTIDGEDPMELGDGKHTSLYREAHGFSQQDVVMHCAFCGSGNIVGRSDGTIECSFCEAVFQVSVEPQFAGMPQTVDGQPYGVDGQPDPNGLAGADDGWAVPNDLSPESGDPVGLGGDDEQNPENALSSEDAGSGGGGAPFQLQGAKEMRFYLTREGDVLDEDRYIKHLAIISANDRRLVLASMRSS